MLAPHVSLTHADLHTLRNSRAVTPVADAVFRVEGAGTIACLQGLLTNDVVKLANHTAAWGAFLTPKGMIISDAWVIRDGDAAWVLTPASAHDTIKQLFARTLPPRLAKVIDQTDTMQLLWLCGGTPPSVDGAVVTKPDGSAPFTAMVLTQHATETTATLIDQGWTPTPPSCADVRKVLIGWPTLGREIDDRTLPQEVRFDELGGVKYDKGCYTGQETVARLHFRGHANRALRGVRWGAGDAPTDVNVTVAGKSVGTLRTIARLGDEYLALAIVRREVAIGDPVRTGETVGVVIEPPFELDPLAVA